MSQHHRNLGVRPEASKAEIKKAYRRIAMQLHPDKNPDPKAGELFAELQDSYDALMNPSSVSNSFQEKQKKRPEKSAKERAKEGRKRYEEHIRRQKEGDERYFQSLVSGKRGLIFKIGILICAVILSSVILDTFLPHHHMPDEFTSFSKVERQRGEVGNKIAVGTAENGLFEVYGIDYFSISTHPHMYVQKTRLLHIPVQLVHPVQGELISYEIQNSFWRLLPFPLFILVFPAVLLFYRKRTPHFTALYMVSTYFVFPLIVIFLITQNRWIHLFTLGYF